MGWPRENEDREHSWALRSHPYLEEKPAKEREGLASEEENLSLTPYTEAQNQVFQEGKRGQWCPNTAEKQGKAEKTTEFGKTEVLGDLEVISVDWQGSGWGKSKR